MSEVQHHFEVQGMKCGGCIERAKKALAELPGFQSAEFDLQASTALVKGNIAPALVSQTLTKMGYPAKLKN